MLIIIVIIALPLHHNSDIPGLYLLYDKNATTLLPISQPPQQVLTISSTTTIIMPNTLYIIFNANASVMGKLSYGYRKLTSPKDRPACAACDITNGGLHLEQSAAWKEAKAEIGREGEVEVRELHRDELGDDVSVRCLLGENEG